MAELFIQYKTIWVGFKTVWSHSMAALNGALQKRGKSNAFVEKQAAKPRPEDHVEDFARPDQQVPAWVWMIGLVITLVVTCVIGAVQWKMNVGLSIFASILGFIFACKITSPPTTTLPPC